MENTIPHESSASKGREHGRHCPGKEEKDRHRGAGWGQVGSFTSHRVPLYAYKYWLWFMNEMKEHVSTELSLPEAGQVRYEDVKQFIEIQLGYRNALKRCH